MISLVVAYHLSSRLVCSSPGFTHAGLFRFGTSCVFLGLLELACGTEKGLVLVPYLV